VAKSYIEKSIEKDFSSSNEKIAIQLMPEKPRSPRPPQAASAFAAKTEAPASRKVESNANNGILANPAGASGSQDAAAQKKTKNISCARIAE